MSGNFSTSFVRDHAVVLAGHVLGYSQALILMPIIIKNVGSETYGGFVVLSSILNVVYGLSSLGIGYTAARMMPSTIGLSDRRALYMPQLMFQLTSIGVLAMLLMALDGPIRTFVLKNQLDYSVLVLPVYLLSYVMYAQGTNYFRFTSRVGVMTIAGVVFPVVNIAVVLLVLFFYDFISINLLVIAQAVASLVIALPMAIIIQREIGLRPTFGAPAALLADLRVGFPLVLNFVVDFLLAASDRWIISVFMGLSAVAYYYPAYAIGSLIMLVPRAMSTALPQLLAQAVDSGDEGQARRMVNYAIRIFLLLGMPFVVGCVVLGRPLLTLLANEDIAVQGHMVVPVVGMGAVFFGLSLILSNVLFVRRRPRSIFTMNALAAAVNVLWNLVLLYVLRDIMVAAWSTLIGYVVAFGYVMKSLRHDWPVEWGPRVLMKGLLSAGVMGAALWALRSQTGGQETAVKMTMEIVLGAVIYAGVFVGVGGVPRSEWAFVTAQLGRRGDR